MNREILYDWIFHFNPYTGKWRCAKRENYVELFSGGEHLFSSSSIHTLEEIILRTKGNIQEADKLLEDDTIREDTMGDE